MPGPFPGMDPYLENRVLWRGVHQGYITFLNLQLNANLPPGFSANMEERVYVAGPELTVFPDILVREEPAPDSSYRGVAAVQARATTLAAAPSPRHVTIIPEQVSEPFIEILQHDTGRVIAVIEVLSPANKAGGAGREEYRRKQREMLWSDAHLIEIDLLRSGQYSVAVPEATLRNRRERWNYLICRHHGGQTAEGPQEFDYWPITLMDRLPPVGVPLVEGFEDVTIDLQVAFDQMYDAGPYRRRIRYDEEPEPPLASEESAWTDALLKVRGVRVNAS